MTEVMLTLFKGQLESECAKLGTDYELTKRGDWLIWWYFMRLHSFTAEDIEEVYCDGGGDLGLDAIWIDDDDVAHFYNFKNPRNPEDVVDAGEIDKMISGLLLIMDRQHTQIANEELRDRVASIYVRALKGYRIHIVTSGQGIPHEAKVKLDSFVNRLGAGLFSWTPEYLSHLHNQFYTRNIPSVEAPIIFKLENEPHRVRSGMGDCYFFSADGQFLAEVYQRHGEGLLERNIRVDQGDTATNKSIEQTCSGDGSANFVHYNNGITFICRTAHHDPFNKQMQLVGSQIVNGGQTIRALHRAFEKGTLRNNIIVPVRAITGSNDKDFANDVAVNQNNQNRMGAGFLRSTDARVVQLGHTLASLGWYLETRAGEVDAFTPEDMTRAEHRIGGHRLDGRVIRMKDGLQAYVATFFGNPELAKKNARLIFLSKEDGGYFEDIFSSLTANQILVAHKIKDAVDDFIKRFAAKKRRKERVVDWQEDYRTLLGSEIVDEFSDSIDQMVPQSGVFLCGTIFQEWKIAVERDPKSTIEEFLGTGDGPVLLSVLRILRYAKINRQIANKGWPSLLKSKSFFDNFIGAIKANSK